MAQHPRDATPGTEPSAEAPAADRRYEELKHKAACRDDATRVRLAARDETPPEILFFLASDRCLSVRAAVALNAATPALADRQLVRDGDDRVRMLLARKLAALTPTLPDDDRVRLGHHVWTNLGLLVEDEVARVRAVVSDLIKDMPYAPRELVLKLACDEIPEVSDPVLRVSPLLTQDDLLGLLNCARTPSAARSIAHRLDMNEAVSDVIARTADTVAIRSLLANRSAPIRESTLDALVSRAADRVEWHAPMVHRPHLSVNATRSLSSMVATNLLESLAKRPDLDPMIVKELHSRLQQRLAVSNPTGQADPAARMEQAMSWADGLRSKATLDEPAMIAAIQTGRAEDVCALLATAAEVPVAAVRRAADLRSAKAIVSLIHKAGFSMRIAGPVQALLCQMAPGALLLPTANGGFPLASAEMAWHLKFILAGTS